MKIINCDDDSGLSANLVINPSYDASGVSINSVNASKLRPAKLLMPHLTFGRNKLEVLLDTGADTSLMKKSVQEYFELPLNTSNKIYIGGVGGQPVQTLGTVTLSGQLFKQDLPNMMFHVVDDAKMNVIAILGDDIMSENKITVNIFQKRLKFDHGNGRMAYVHLFTEDINNSPITYVNVPTYVQNNVIIPAKSTKLVPIIHNVPYNGDTFMFEAHNCSRRLQTIADIPSALMYLPRNHKILVSNKTDKRIHIFKSELIGHFTTAFEHDPNYTPSEFDSDLTTDTATNHISPTNDKQTLLVDIANDPNLNSDIITDSDSVSSSESSSTLNSLDSLTQILCSVPSVTSYNTVYSNNNSSNSNLGTNINKPTLTSSSITSSSTNSSQISSSSHSSTTPSSINTIFLVNGINLNTPNSDDVPRPVTNHSSTNLSADNNSAYSLNMSKSMFYVNSVSQHASPSSTVDSVHWTKDILQQQIKLGDNLDQGQKDTVLELLLSKSHVLSTCDEDIGQLGIGQHRIKLSDCTPVYMKPRRFPDPVTQEIDKQVHELLTNDIIEPSCSPYNSPIVPVRKPDGSLRLCIDYRKLNEVTTPDRFPMPNLLDEIYKLQGVKYFTSLDLTRGYYQMPMADDSKDYTAFSTAHGHWQFKRMPFGLRNAPGSFQRMILDVLKGFSRSSVIVYIDDILILSEDFESHRILVEKVLTTLGDHGLKIKPRKCEFFSNSVDYLGHTISSDGLTKPKKFIDKVNDYPKPKTVRQLQEFLGFANFQRKFVPHFSEIAQPLYKQITRNSRRIIQWDDTLDKSFDDLKTILARDIRISFPDYSEGAELLELYVDASGRGAGACLGQVQDGCWRIIAFDSMTFSETQRNYSTIERELAAMRWGVKTFKAFLFGQEFILHTDHQPLTYLQNMKLVDQRLARTLSDLEGYQPILKYTPGSQNEAADALSRLASGPYIPPDTVTDPTVIPDGLKVIQRLEGGGDSLFESLIIAFKDVLFTNQQFDTLSHLSTFTPKTLREHLVGLLVKSPAKYGLSKDKFKTKHLSLMKNPGQLPCQEVVSVFSDIFKVQVLVHYGPTLPLVFGQTNSSFRVHLQCLAGIHYNPLQELKEYNISTPEVHYSWSHPNWYTNISEPTDSESIDDDSTSEINLRQTLSSINCLHSGSSRAHTRLRVGEKFYCACLDTGAQISAISESIVRENSLATEDIANTSILGVNRDGVDVLGVVNLTFKIDLSETIHTFPCAVVPDTAMNVCCLLGLNFLDTVDIDIDLGNMRLVNHNYSVTLGISPHSPESDIALMVNQLSLQTNSSKINGIISDQENSNFLRRLKNRIRNKLPITDEFKSYSRCWNKLAIVGNVLCHNKIPVVSDRFLLNIVIHTHIDMAHIGSLKLFELIKQHAYHPSLRRIVLDTCTTCAVCQRNKPTSKLTIPPTYKIKTLAPFELMAMDLVSLPPSHGYIGLLVMVDHFSKWLAVAPIRDKKAKTISHLLETQILPGLVQVPSRILTDNGPEFCSFEFNELMEKYQIHHIHTTAYKPSSNGAVERVNRTIIGFLRDLSSKTTSWYPHLQKAIIIYNQTTHNETKASPSRFLLERPHISMKDVPIVTPETQELWAQGHPQYEPFKVNQSVLKRRELPGRLNVHKLEYKFNGPYKVTKINSNKVTYQLTCSETGQVIKAHHSQLKAWKNPPDYILEHLERFPLTKVLDFGNNSSKNIIKDDDDYVYTPILPTVPTNSSHNGSSTVQTPLFSPFQPDGGQSPFTPNFSGFYTEPCVPNFAGFGPPILPLNLNGHSSHMTQNCAQSSNLMELPVPHNLHETLTPIDLSTQSVALPIIPTCNDQTNIILNYPTVNETLPSNIVTPDNSHVSREIIQVVTTSPVAETSNASTLPLEVISQPLNQPMMATANISLGYTPLPRTRSLFSTSTPVNAAIAPTGMKFPLLTPVNASAETDENSSNSQNIENNQTTTDVTQVVHHNSTPTDPIQPIPLSNIQSSPIIRPRVNSCPDNMTTPVRLPENRCRSLTILSPSLIQSFSANQNSNNISRVITTGINPPMNIVFVTESSGSEESYNNSNTFINNEVFPFTQYQLAPNVIEKSLMFSQSANNTNIRPIPINDNNGFPEAIAGCSQVPTNNINIRDPELETDNQSINSGYSDVSNLSLSEFVLQVPVNKSLDHVDELVTSLQQSNEEQELDSNKINETCSSILSDVANLRQVFSTLAAQARLEATIIGPGLKTPTRPHTRRRGSVPNLPNVMDQPLEHKPRKLHF